MSDDLTAGQLIAAGAIVQVHRPPDTRDRIAAALFDEGHRRMPDTHQGDPSVGSPYDIQENQ